MANPNLSLAMDDDLPRTFRRDKAEKAARDREAADAAERLRADDSAREADMPRIVEARSSEARSFAAPSVEPGHAYHPAQFGPLVGEMQPAEVRALNIPFLHLMMFCLKLVVAAIPAIILLGAILYGLGQILKIYLPWLVQAEIFIRFPK